MWIHMTKPVPLLALPVAVLARHVIVSVMPSSSLAASPVVRCRFCSGKDGWVVGFLRLPKITGAYQLQYKGV